jgi:hypothetical protein
MTPHSLRARLDKLAAACGGRCRPNRQIVYARDGDPMPPLEPCPDCGDPECGTTTVIEVVIVGTDDEGNFLDA